MRLKPEDEQCLGYSKQHIEQTASGLDATRSLCRRVNAASTQQMKKEFIFLEAGGTNARGGRSWVSNGDSLLSSGGLPIARRHNDANGCVVSASRIIKGHVRHRIADSAITPMTENIARTIRPPLLPLPLLSALRPLLNPLLLPLNTLPSLSPVDQSDRPRRNHRTITRYIYVSLYNTMAGGICRTLWMK